MLTIGDAMAFASICIVIVIAIFRFSDGNSVKEKECLLRSKNICNKLGTLKENIDELFNQFNELNRHLRDVDK